MGTGSKKIDLILNSQVPVDIPSDVTELRLQSNRITRLDDQVFSGLRNLTFLDVSMNPLEHLDSGCFSGLETLKRLYMFHVVLRSFPNDVFWDTPALEVCKYVYVCVMHVCMHTCMYVCMCKYLHYLLLLSPGFSCCTWSRD